MAEARTPDLLANAQVLDGLFLLMRNARTYGNEHPETRATAAEAARLASLAATPFSYQFVAGAVFRDRTLLPLPLASFRHALSVGEALAHLRAHELTFERPPTPATLATLGAALARGLAGPSDLLQELVLPGVRWREIPNARIGVDVEAVAPDVLVAAQIALALVDVESVVATRGQPWVWSTGSSVVRRVERAVEADPRAAECLIETLPVAWGLPRRVLAACIHAQGILQRLEVGLSNRRAVGHACLALAVHGFMEHEGHALEEAARRAMGAVLEAPVSARTGVEPHRLRVSALLHSLAHPGQAPTLPTPAALLRLAYELECWRCPAGLDQPLTMLDLLARASMDPGQRHQRILVRALMDVTGRIPVGSSVVLADGRPAVVVGEGHPGDPWRPEVELGGSRVIPPARVSVLSGLLQGPEG
jgi:hypothetical protein